MKWYLIVLINSMRLILWILFWVLILPISILSLKGIGILLVLMGLIILNNWEFK